jgi:hypothetical protein
MPQFNGKQEGPPGPNLRCPRNGKRSA